VDYIQAEGPESARDRIENVNALINGAAETVIDDGGAERIPREDALDQLARLLRSAAANGCAGCSAPYWCCARTARLLPKVRDSSSAVTTGGRNISSA